MMHKTPTLRKSGFEWYLDWGWMAIYCYTIAEAKRVAERIRWRVRTGARPTFTGYRDDPAVAGAKVDFL